MLTPINDTACHGENKSFATAIERSGKDITAFYDARDDFDVPDDESESEHDSDADLDDISEPSSDDLTDEDDMDEDDSTSEDQEYYPAE